MKRILIAMIALLLVVSGIAYTSDKAEAAGKTMYVNAKSDIILRDKPTKNAKKIGSVKNKMAVTVLLTTKEWSQIQVGKQKGYVYSSALSAKNPNKKVPPVVTGGLYPEIGLKLTYDLLNLERGYYQQEVYNVVKDDYYDSSYEGSSKRFMEPQKRVEASGSGLGRVVDDVYMDYDSTKRLRFDYGEGPMTSFIYPMKEGSYTQQYVEDWFFVHSIEKTRVLVESTSKTIKVEAGTFKNVVILKYPDNSRLYFVKGIGLIKQTDANGRIISELISVK